LKEWKKEKRKKKGRKTTSTTTYPSGEGETEGISVKKLPENFIFNAVCD
jgi:hypothetical protein